MGLSKTTAACRCCPYAASCDHKKLEAYGYLQPTAGEAGMVDMAAPLLRKQDLRQIKVDDETCITLDLEELKEQMQKDFYRNMGLGLLPGS